MVDKLNGTWKLSGGDSPDEYLQAVGFGRVLRTIASYASPSVQIEIYHNRACIRTKIAVMSFETSGYFGEEFDEEPPDHKMCRSLLYVAGDVLVQVQRWDNNKAIIKRFVNDHDEMIMELQIGEVKCRRIFKRLSSLSQNEEENFGTAIE